MHILDFLRLSFSAVTPAKRCIHNTILSSYCLVWDFTSILVRIQFFNRFVDSCHIGGVVGG
jgi:hypothetical protein